MLHIQGDLQAVFDALFDMGVIDPLLKKDWRAQLKEMEAGSPALERAIRLVNACGRDRGMIASELKKLDAKTLEILAMEVAREYAEFHSRPELH